VDYMLAQGKKKFYLIGTDLRFIRRPPICSLQISAPAAGSNRRHRRGFRKDDSGKVFRWQVHALGHTDYQQICGGDQAVCGQR